MPRHYDAEQVLEILLGIAGSASGRNPSGWVNLIPDRQTSIAKKAKPKRRAATAAGKKYGRAFRRLCPQYKKKDGSWKKDGFKRCQKAAHALAKKG